MRFVDEFRDGRLARRLAAEIAALAVEPVRIMDCLLYTSDAADE